MSKLTVVCPACNGDLIVSAAEVTCRNCGRAYPAEGDRYDLRFEGASSSQHERWERAQELGSGSYRVNPTANCSRWLDGGRYARAFGEFCCLDGRVLDVGCGPYGPYDFASSAPGTELIGIDPLPPAVPGSAVYRAMAEHLPFPARTFDHVIMVSSLDHVLDPAAALAEARRVLRPGGRLHIWTHIHPPASRRLRDLAAAAVRRLFQPRRWPSVVSGVGLAVSVLRRRADEPDEHHLRLLGPDAARSLLRAAGFSVDRQASHGGHIFFLSGRTDLDADDRSGAATAGPSGA